MKRFRLRLRQWFLYGGAWKQVILYFIVTIAIFYLTSIIIKLCWLNDLAIEDKCGGGTNNPAILWQLYYLFADPGNQMSLEWTSDTGRIIGLMVSTLGSIFLSGLLISTFVNIFERRADRSRAGLIYHKFKNHIVIIGSDQMVVGLVKQLCNRSNDTIVVMTSKDVEGTRKTLKASLRTNGFNGLVVVNYGTRDSEEYLKAVNITAAKEVYILGDTSDFDEIENYHDSLNVQCMELIAKLCKQEDNKKCFFKTLIAKLRKKNADEEAKPRRLPCHTLLEYKTTYHLFQYADLASDVANYIDFHPFNFYDSWARKVFVSGKSRGDGGDEITYKSLDYTPITTKDSKKFVHLVVIGMSRMGEAMALQAAHIAHFPNYEKQKTKITFIDSNGQAEMNQFKQKCGELFKVSRSTFIDADAWLKAQEQWREGDDAFDKERYIQNYGIAEEYKHLVENDTDKEFIDVEWEFIKGEDNNPIVQELLQQYAEDENAILTVAVCLNITNISLRSAMFLPKVYYEKNIPILVQQRKTSTLVTTLNGKLHSKDGLGKYKNLAPFGMVTDCYDINLVSSIEICKRIAATYDHYFKSTETEEEKKYPTQLDNAYVEDVWNNTKISKRWSNIYAAVSIPTKLRCIGIDEESKDITTLLPVLSGKMAVKENATLLAEIEHNRWNIEELLLGYRPVTANEDTIIDNDKSKKDEYKNCFIHYDIRPYDKLKPDGKKNIASVYDMVIVKSLPVILEKTTDSNTKKC